MKLVVLNAPGFIHAAQKTNNTIVHATLNNNLCKYYSIARCKHNYHINDYDVMLVSLRQQPTISADNKVKSILANYLRHHRPSAILIEADTTVVTHQSGRPLDVLLSILASNGYCVQYKFISNNDYGYPLVKRKLFLIAIMNNLSYQHINIFGAQQLYTTVNYVCDYLQHPALTWRYNILHRDIMLFSETKLSLRRKTKRIVQLGFVYNNGKRYTLYHSYGQAQHKHYKYFLTPERTIRPLTPREVARINGYDDSYVLPDDDIELAYTAADTVLYPLVELFLKKVGELIC